MAGVLERMRRSRKQIVKQSMSIDLVPTPTKVLELQTAKEILAEIFNARSSDVDDMIQKRLSERTLPMKKDQAAEELWPEMFWAEG